MTLAAGTTVRLYVRREAPPYGWYLGEDERDGPEVLLPYAEAVRQRPEAGDAAEVFLFHDDKNRLTATQRQPLLRLGQLGRLRVADFHPRFGCFLEMGIGRQLLLPFKELPREKAEWPQVGDELHVVMKHDKEGRMLARLAGLDDFTPLAVRAPASWRGEEREGWVTGVHRDGAFALVDGGVLGFGVLGYVPQGEMKGPPLRLGQRVRGRVLRIRDDGRVTLTLRPPKEAGRLEDADMLLAFLRERPGGAMPYSDETDADIIRRRFGLSKSAFKRALGKLMKEGLIEQQGNWTRLRDGAGAAERREPAGELSGKPAREPSEADAT